MLAQVNIADEFYAGGGSAFRDLTGVGRLVSLGVRFVFVAAGIIVIFFVIFGGYSLIAGAGNNDPRQTGQGKQALTAAVVGFVIIFVSYWIVLFIQTATGIIILY